MKYIKTAVPDIILKGDKYKGDELYIFIGKKEIMFEAFIDGTGNTFVLDKQKLNEVK